METTTTSNAANFTHLPDSVFEALKAHHDKLGNIRPERRWLWAGYKWGLSVMDSGIVQEKANTLAGRSNLRPNPFKSKG